MSRKGIGLIEVLIVLVVIGILAYIVIPATIRAQMFANEAITKKKLSTFATALEQYYNENGEYPQDVRVLITTNPPYTDENLLDGKDRNGYYFTIAGGVPTKGTYFISATPIACKRTGRYVFYMDTGMRPSQTECAP